jgi:hypothetical protein
MIVSKGTYSISTNKNKMDIGYIHDFLTRSYLSEGIAKETVLQSVNGSLCFGVYYTGKQAGSLDAYP